MTLEAARDPRPPSLDFAMNLRDLGGMPARGGLVTRRGRLFRTGNLAHLDAEQAAVLVERLGLAAYCDLRVAHEIEVEGRPDALVAAGVAWRPMPIDSFDPAFRRHTLPTSAHWTDCYASVFGRHLAVYAELVRAAAESPAPIAFGCSAGKDRTGVATALILRCLGVDHRAILADYARTSEELLRWVDRFGRYFADGTRTREQFVTHYLVADPDTLAGFLAGVERRWGSVEAALAEGGLDAATVEALRERCLARR